MPKLDVTLTLTELETMLLRLEIERGDAFRGLQWADAAIAVKAIESRKKAVRMAIACVKYVAANANP